MRFADVVDASAAVATASARLQKIARLAELFRALAPEEIEPVIALLSGTARQGRIGLGYATISEVSHVTPADSPQLTVAEVDTALSALAETRGAGSARGRVEKLSALFARATREEQDFLRRILYGELRQGALEGVVLEAVAKAAGIAAARLRRAVLMAGIEG